MKVLSLGIKSHHKWHAYVIHQAFKWIFFFLYFENVNLKVLIYQNMPPLTMWQNTFVMWLCTILKNSWFNRHAYFVGDICKAHLHVKYLPTVYVKALNKYIKYLSKVFRHTKYLITLNNNVTFEVKLAQSHSPIHQCHTS